MKEIENCKKNFSDMSDGLQKNLESALRGLEEDLKQELNKLSEIRTALLAEEEKLETIYGIKNAAVSLQEFLQLVQEQKKSWEREKEEYEKMRQREEEYAYNLKLKRKKEQDEYIEQQNKIKALFEEEMRDQRSEFEEQKEKLEQQFAKLEDLRKLKAQFDTMKNKAVQESLAQQQKDLQRDFDTRFTLENQQRQAEKTLLEQKIKTLDEQTAHYLSELNLLKKELRLANDKAQELALTIIQSQQKKEVKFAEVGEKVKD